MDVATVTPCRLASRCLFLNSLVSSWLVKLFYLSIYITSNWFACQWSQVHTDLVVNLHNLKWKTCQPALVSNTGWTKSEWALGSGKVRPGLDAPANLRCWWHKTVVHQDSGASKLRIIFDSAKFAYCFFHIFLPGSTLPLYTSIGVFIPILICGLL